MEMDICRTNKKEFPYIHSQIWAYIRYLLDYLPKDNNFTRGEVKNFTRGEVKNFTRGEDKNFTYIMNIYNEQINEHK